MHINAKSVALLGIEPQTVRVQIQIARGLPAFNIVGLGDKAVCESKERVRASLNSLNIQLPIKRITVNLAPADLYKEGSHYDLAIALGILALLGLINSSLVERYFILGELGLDANVYGVRGILAAAIHAKDYGIICPIDNYSEAYLAENSDIIPLRHLNDLIDNKIVIPDIPQPEELPSRTFPLINGHAHAKRGLLIAAAGGHNLLFSGPPGVGKSLLAQTLPLLLPPLSKQESLEVSTIYSIAGLLPQNSLISQRPFRSPHHTASMVSLIGGGNKKSQLGEVTLAHHGVMFLDEIPEHSNYNINSLREPMESGQITISRAHYRITYPCRFQLVAAMNPCRCGYFGVYNKQCKRAPGCAEDYQGKISGPILDRIDIFLTLQALSSTDIMQKSSNDNWQAIQQQVLLSRKLQMQRQNCTNAWLQIEQLQQELTSGASRFLKQALENLSISARGYCRLLRISRTIADLDNSREILENHCAEAVNFRQ